MHYCTYSKIEREINVHKIPAVQIHIQVTFLLFDTKDSGINCTYLLLHCLIVKSVDCKIRFMDVSQNVNPPKCDCDNSPPPSLTSILLMNCFLLPVFECMDLNLNWYGGFSLNFQDVDLNLAREWSFFPLLYSWHAQSKDLAFLNYIWRPQGMSANDKWGLKSSYNIYFLI